jgi:hypothetical protein
MLEHVKMRAVMPCRGGVFGVDRIVPILLCGDGFGFRRDGLGFAFVKHERAKDQS